MRARLTVDLDALAQNYAILRKVAEGTEVAGVVKADAYGMGLAPVARRLRAEGCRTFFVAGLDEGLALRSVLGPGPAIHVLDGVIDADEAETCLAGELTPVLNSLAMVEVWTDAGLGAPATVQIDTGMRRLGLAVEDLDPMQDPPFPLALIMSHLACASDPESPMNGAQAQAFVQAVARLPGAPLSLAASAGTFLGPAFRFDMVRGGIALYGGAPFDAAVVPLAPVATLEAPMLTVFDVGPGDTVGYGATWQADRRRRLATVALGYADGFLRSGSNRGFAAVEGAICPIVGRVSMDLITLDVTEAGRAARPGVMAQFLGPQAPLDAQAAAAGTIGYELLTRLGPRVQRRYDGDA